MLSDYEIDECRRIINGCIRVMDLHGVNAETVTCHTFESDADKWAAWAADSMRFVALQLLRADGLAKEGMRHQAASEALCALRGLLQASEYRGRRGGYLPCGLADYRIDLQNMMEGILRKGIAS